MYYVESGFFHPVLSLSHSSTWSCVLLLYFFRRVELRHVQVQRCILFAAVGHWGSFPYGAMADRLAAYTLVPVSW